MVGKYIYGDYLRGNMWALDYDGQNPPSNMLISNAVKDIVSFGVDENRELYWCNIANGRLYQFQSTISSIKNNYLTASLKVIPNPISKQGAIQLTLSQSQKITLSIFDVLGKRMETILAGKMSEGEHIVEWNTKNYQPSSYYAVLFTEESQIIQQLIKQ